MALSDSGYYMNIAPEPASGSGVFRLVAELDGEKVIRADTHIGFSHRGIEKLMEKQNCLQGLFFCDKLCHPVPFVAEHSYVLAVEKLLGLVIPPRAVYIRTLFAELARIASHLQSVSNLASDTGTDAVYPVTKKACRQIYGFFQQTCGVSLPAGFFRAGGVKKDIPAGLPDEIFFWLTKEFPLLMQEVEDLLTENSIFKARTVGIGVIDSEEALNAGFSGVNLRASGVEWDLRRAQPYEAYGKIDIGTPVGKTGDCYARYLLRIHEIHQSLSAVRQLISLMPEGDILLPEYASFVQDGDGSVESAACRFKLFAEGINLLPGEVYAATESPLGELGVYLVSDGGAQPYRCHFRSACFPHLQAVNKILKGLSLADIRPVLSSLNIMMTEADR